MGELSGIDVPRADQAPTFLTALRELREEAGNPSFRKMAQVSGCVSHTTLHEAATGARFPSWETTREFVRACGADPEPWLPRWKQARGEPEDETPPPPAHHSRRRLAVLAGVALLLLGIAAGVIFMPRGTSAPAP